MRKLEPYFQLGFELVDGELCSFCYPHCQELIDQLDQLKDYVFLADGRSYSISCDDEGGAASIQGQLGYIDQKVMPKSEVDERLISLAGDYGAHLVLGLRQIADVKIEYHIAKGFRSIDPVNLPLVENEVVMLDPGERVGLQIGGGHLMVRPFSQNPMRDALNAEMRRRVAEAVNHEIERKSRAGTFSCH